MDRIKLGFALCGSFCTFSRAIAQMEQLVALGYEVTPIMSFHAYETDTRFGKAADFVAQAEKISGHSVLHTLTDTEPIGPKRMFDLLAVVPCTGNTLAKLALGIVDTPVTMAVKSHLRIARPVVIAVSTNDALSNSAKNIGALMNRKHYFFVPMSQDNFEKKPTSVVADFDKLALTISAALENRQLQPILCNGVLQ